MPPLGLAASAALFGSAALFVLFALEVAAPALAGSWRGEPILVWFAATGSSIFLPIGVVGGWLLYRETGSVWPRDWSERLRFRRLGAIGWGVVAGALIVIGAASLGVVTLLERFAGPVPMAPPAMVLEPLTPDRYWILAVWLPLFAFGLAVEEVVWRGVVLPRQEAAFGRHAWWIHGLGWLLMHAAFPWPVLATLVPTALVLPWAVQRLGNSWAGVMLHAALNGGGFLALAFGWV